MPKFNISKRSTATGRSLNSMPTYPIEIAITLAKRFKVKAANVEEAMAKVRNSYYAKEINLNEKDDFAEAADDFNPQIFDTSDQYDCLDDPQGKIAKDDIAKLPTLPL